MFSGCVQFRSGEIGRDAPRTGEAGFEIAVGRKDEIVVGPKKGTWRKRIIEPMELAAGQIKSLATRGVVQFHVLSTRYCGSVHDFIEDNMADWRGRGAIIDDGNKIARASN